MILRRNMRATPHGANSTYCQQPCSDANRGYSNCCELPSQSPTELYRAPTGTDLCPMQDFTQALRHLESHMRAGTLLRAGGEETLLQHYVARFGSRRCVFNEGASEVSRFWPRSQRPAQRPVIIDTGDGTTGTRFLACIGRTLGLRVDHNIVSQPTNATAFYDTFDMLLDSPIPYQTHHLLATHARNQTVLMLTVRDPWDWLDSRLTHHPQRAASWGAAGGGCALTGTKLGSPNSTTLVPRDLLTYWAWSVCRMAKREHGGLSAVPIIHLFEDDQCSSLSTMLQVFAKAGHRYTSALIEDIWNGTRCGPGALIPTRGCDQSRAVDPTPMVHTGMPRHPPPNSPPMRFRSHDLITALPTPRKAAASPSHL